MGGAYGEAEEEQERADEAADESELRSGAQELGKVEDAAQGHQEEDERGDRGCVAARRWRGGQRDCEGRGRCEGRGGMARAEGGARMAHDGGVDAQVNAALDRGPSRKQKRCAHSHTHSPQTRVRLTNIGLQYAALRALK